MFNTQYSSGKTACIYLVQRTPWENIDYCLLNFVYLKSKKLMPIILQ